MNYLVRKLCIGVSLSMGLVSGANATYVNGNPLKYTDPSGLIKINLLPPGTLHDQFDHIPDDPNSVIVGAHGGYDFWSNLYTSQLLGPDGKPISAQDLADRINNTAGFKDGMPVKLYACGTGYSGKTGVSYGQQLADQFWSSSVSAPIGSVTANGWSYSPVSPYAWMPGIPMNPPPFGYSTSH